MDHLLVRYSEIGTKSAGVRRRMLGLLQRRVSERLEYEGYDSAVESIRGRILAQTDRPGEAANAVAELPGVASASPVIRTEPTISAIEDASDALPIGETFGVDTNVAGERSFSSQEVNERIGARVQDRTGAAVDLDDPDTWVEVDVRDEGAFVFTDRVEGPGGFPVGAQAPVAALISGGIDSPVAAYEVMTRGADIVPIYFYNKPYAAGDHLLRFEASLSHLRRIHPAKQWYFYKVDMNDVNEALFEVGKGRMLLHRIVLFRTAERIAMDDGLRALVTGEAIGQKSSQTVTNLELTTAAVSKPVFRPLLTWTKDDIVRVARRLGTFEEAVIDSACRTIAPENPTPAMDPTRLEELKAEVDLEALVDRAYEATERVEY